MASWKQKILKSESSLGFIFTTKTNLHKLNFVVLVRSQSQFSGISRTRNQNYALASHKLDYAPVLLYKLFSILMLSFTDNIFPKGQYLY